MKPRLNITTKLVGYLLAISLLPLLIFGIWSYDLARTAVLSQASDYSRQQIIGQRQYLELQMQQIESLADNISGVQDILSLMAQADLQSASSADPYHRLSTQAKVGYILNGYSRLKGLVSIDLLTPKGQHFHVGDTLSVSDIDQVARKDLYSLALESKDRIIWGGVSSNLNIYSNSHKVVTATKILTNYSESGERTTPLGMLVISYSTEYLHNRFSQVAFGDHAYMLLVDANHRLIYHPDPKQIGTALSKAFATLLDSDDASEMVSIAGQKVLITHTKMPQLGWRLVSIIPSKTLLLPMTSLQNTGLSVAAICLVIIVFFARIYARWLVNPIRLISKGFRNIEEHPDAPLENLPQPKSQDEISELVKWFNTFLDSLRARRASDEVIWNQANFDILTGLPNRRLFRDRLATELKRTARNSQYLALCFIDLDDFNNVNDGFGHDAGDAVLVEIANRLKSVVRESDTVSRLGADEFTVLLSSITHPSDAGLAADKILRAFEAPFIVPGGHCHVTASIGISYSPGDTKYADHLLQNADQAMYASKRDGRNRYTYFSASMREQSLARQSLRVDLRKALPGNQFALHFQPIYELATGRILKAEALLRWHHPTRGLVSPVDFIPIAEETGLINEIGEWVFQQVLPLAHRWNAMLGHPIQISINRSPVEFRDNPRSTNWPDQIRALGLPSNIIAIEITEGLLLNASPSVTEQLKHYRSAGVQIAIDDFGTGYSSMAYLRHFSIDYLKIDRSFIVDMETDAGHRAITQAVISMAHNLGLKVIAEGIETVAQHDLLLAAGCDYGQGFLLSRPCTSSEFESSFISNAPNTSCNVVVVPFRCAATGPGSFPCFPRGTCPACKAVSNLSA